MPLLMSIICGLICGRIVYRIYDNKIEKEVYEEEVYLVQAGEYDTYEKMVKNTLVNDYVYYEDDDGLFKSVVGITENKNNIDKIKNIFGGDLVVNKYYSKNVDFNKLVKNYDDKLRTSEDNEEIKKTILEMLGLYKGDSNKTLIKIS